jgi:hypothetical protein
MILEEMKMDLLVRNKNEGLRGKINKTSELPVLLWSPVISTRLICEGVVEEYYQAQIRTQKCGYPSGVINLRRGCFGTILCAHFPVERVRERVRVRVWVRVRVRVWVR